MDYSAYQQQQQQPYDPSQNQAYDQSSQSYYGYNQQYDQQYAYYPNQDQGISYAQQANQQFQLEPTSINPPGVPILPEHNQMQNQQNVHYLTGVSENQQQPNPDLGAAVAGAVNPEAAVATLSQFTHFAGNSAPHPPIGQFRYRGGGGRGNRPFRRGGWGNFNPRGRGPYRGRGRGRHFPSHSSGPGNSYVEIVPAAAGAPSVPQVSSSVSGNVSLPAPAQVPTAPAQVPTAPAQVPTAPLQPRKAWCEICKVECNTPEILEQHKNGKRHKKNVLVHEELQRHKSINGQQSGRMPTSQLNSTVQAEKLPESNSEGCPVENMGSEATDDNPKDETEVQNNIGETSEVSADKPEGNPRDGFAPRGRGLKRKMRGGRGGKYMRPNDGSRRPVEPPKPKQPIAFICELCNVKCESQIVYDSHLTGKKHQSSLKRVHGHQALSGEQGLQAIYPTDISALSNSIDINALSNSINSQVQQGVNDPQVLLAQLLMTVLSQTQASAVAPPSGSVAAQVSAPSLVVGSSHESQFQSASQTQVSETTAHGGKENPSGETKGELEAPKTAEGSSETEEVQKLPQNSSVPTPAENPIAANEHPSETEEVQKLPQNSSVPTPAENPIAANEHPSECKAPNS